MSILERIYWYTTSCEAITFHDSFLLAMENLNFFTARAIPAAKAIVATISPPIIR